MKEVFMFASIYIPNFSLQAALRHQTDLRLKPVAMVDPELSKPVIVELNSAARHFGVIPGFTASQAMARCPALTIQNPPARARTGGHRNLAANGLCFFGQH